MHFYPLPRARGNLSEQLRHIIIIGEAVSDKQHFQTFPDRGRPVVAEMPEIPPCGRLVLRVHIDRCPVFCFHLGICIDRSIFIKGMRADLRHARRQNHIIQRGAADKCVVSHRHDPVAEFDRRDPACPAVPRRVMLRSIVGNCPAALNFKNIPVFPVVGKTCRHRIGQLPGRIFLRLRTPRKERRKQNKRCQNRHQSQTLFCSVHIVFFLAIMPSIAKYIRSFSRQIVSAFMAGCLCRTLNVALFLLLSVFCPFPPSLCVPFGIFPAGFTRIITRFFLSVNTLKKIYHIFADTDVCFRMTRYSASVLNFL